MKKRAQFPDAYTFTILLKGLANSPSPSKAVAARAATLLHSMTAPNSRTEPSIIHVNAALMACSRSHDMDAMWGIVSRISEKGPNAADNITFATIFNAMKANAELNPSHLDPKSMRALASEATVTQARQMWPDVVRRWRAGELIMDEKLVCSLGRLLLIGGNPQDWDDVLSLVEQTMRIPRRAPPLRLGQIVDEDGEELPFLLGNRERKATDQSEPFAGEEFAIVPQDFSVRRASLRPNSQSASLYYALPSNQTLQIIMEACELLCIKKSARKYWDFLTDAKGPAITPDLPNCLTYLRIMRTAKASSEAVEFVRETMKHLPHLPKTYRIAMSTCVKNRASPNAISEAEDLMNLMTRHLHALDPRVCVMYVELALESPDSQKTLAAVKRLSRWMEKQVKKNSLSTETAKEEYFKGDKRAVLELAGIMIRAYNRVLKEENLIAQEYTSEYNRTSSAGSSPASKFSIRDQFGERLRQLTDYIAQADKVLGIRAERRKLYPVVREKYAKQKMKGYSKERSDGAEKWSEETARKDPASEPTLYYKLLLRDDFNLPDLGVKFSSESPPSFAVRYGPHGYVQKRTNYEEGDTNYITRGRRAIEKEAKDERRFPRLPR